MVEIGKKLMCKKLQMQSVMLVYSSVMLLNPYINPKFKEYSHGLLIFCYQVFQPVGFSCCSEFDKNERRDERDHRPIALSIKSQ